MKVIALEEHFVTSEVQQAWQSLEAQYQDLAFKASSGGEGGRRLLELGPGPAGGYGCSRY